MTDHVLQGIPPVALTLRRSSRARRMSLRISGLDGRVTLTVPPGTSEREALDFARSKAEWLRGRLAGVPVQQVVRPGMKVPVEGQPRQVAQGEGRGIYLIGDEILLPRGDAQGRRLRAWFRTLARERLSRASDRHAANLGLDYSRITLRDTRSRWGSCTSAGALMYSWRLIMAPPDVLDYVAAHEVAHLGEMNHSARFWRLVAQLRPDFETQRRWLHRNGADLHRYRFDD
ncbi:M48 family peptidase [Roseovarius sp. TE539]|uniref:M48 family metallopeptidase n=1 Tax=Roseovarius sp. TE539 TaxID=2249812 RepID=UPI000DDE6A4F|nr:SprT family zinc-dependent metalloprotease [Roseovarius sp. TE539]RBI74051.1 M48 family peptidase [Roseovarius sp. TE539]